MLTLLCRSRPILFHVSSHPGLNYSSRFLSVSETAVALRPFLFMVHPDLFGKFPKEQAINEQSLKLLNEYIEKLHSCQEVRPVSLIFYMRNHVINQQARTSGHVPNEGSIETFRSVQLLLGAKNLQDAVRSVLGACSLPLEFVNNIRSSETKAKDKDKTSADTDSPLWQAVVNATFKRHKHRSFDFFAEVHSRQPVKDTLVEWLKKNILMAHKRNLVTKPVRQDIQRLKDTLQEQTGITDVRWESDWVQASFRTALKGLLRICSTHLNEIDLRDRTVIFGNKTGVCIRGNVILCYDSVPENWISILTSPHKYTGDLHRIPSVEKYLSTLLNDIEIVSRSHLPVVLAKDYLNELKKLVNSIKDYQAKDNCKSKVYANLEGVQLVVECAAGPLMISQSGQILVPSSCPAFLVIDFINENAAKVRRICEEFKTIEKDYRDVVNRCRAVLGFESLTADTNVSRQQMISCCNRLVRLSDMRALDVDLTSCHLKVTHFYSVTSEGDVCIPWNFEDFSEA